MMTDIYENLTLCINEIRKKTDMIPETAIVLGSGLNNTVLIFKMRVS